MTQYAPLLLLFDKPIDEVSQRLDAYVDLTDDIFSGHQKFANSAPLSLLYDGLVFSARFVDLDTDVARYKNILCNINTTKTCCALGIDLGDNIKGGETIAPIIKGLLALARRLGQGSGAIATAWTPALIVSDFGYFAQAVTSYENDGAFPVLALVDFQSRDDDVIVTRGLAFLSTQEVSFVKGDLPLDEVTRRLVRIVHDIATNGPVTVKLEVEGMRAREIIHLIPSISGQEVRAEMISKSDA